MAFASQANAIDLHCEVFTDKMVAQLADEGLLNTSAKTESRSRTISLNMCSEMQASAVQQHEENKAAALKNWLFEHKADNPGNKRLKSFKR